MAESNSNELDRNVLNALKKIELATIGHYTEFGFMSPDICLLFSHPLKVVGPALTIRTPPQDSYAVHMAVDVINEGDILVIDRSLNLTHACVGEMVAMAASLKGATAIVVDGPVTDAREISEIGIPVFCRGTAALTTKLLKTGGEVNQDISCGGVPVHPRDIIMGDMNGVLVLRPFEVERLIKLSLQDQADEVLLKQELKLGKSLPKLCGLYD